MFHKMIASAVLSALPSLLAAQEVAVDRAQKEWTILVFLNADNNLESYGYDDVREMEKIGSTSDVNVVVQFDRISPSGTPRFLVEKNERPYNDRRRSFNSTIIEDLPEQDMGDKKVLEDFLEWGTKNFPAKHYALVMWNHGSGWKKEDEVALVKGISFDDTSGNHITTLQFADVMTSFKARTGRSMDIVAFDACLMAMAEVVDGLVGSVDYVLAAEEVVPGMGQPYDGFLNAFTGREKKSPRVYAQDWVREFGLSYSGGSQGVASFTMSALDLSKFEAMKRKFNLWMDSLHTRSGLSEDEIKKAAAETLSFYDSDYRDLGDYVRRLLKLKLKKDEMTMRDARAIKAPGFISSSLALQDAMDELVIENSTSVQFQAAKGLAIYLPSSVWGYWSPWSSSFPLDVELKNEYQKLSWAQSTLWTSHLDRLFPN